MNRRVSIWLCLCCLSACHAASSPAVEDLASPDAIAKVTLDQVQRVGAVEHAADGVAQQRYVFQPATQPQIVLAPTSGTWDWSTQGELRLRVQNAMSWAVTLNVDIDGAGAGQHLHAVVGVVPGPAQTLVIPLHATSPRAFGMQVGPPMPFDEAGHAILLATTVEGTLDLHEVHAVRIGMSAPQAAQTLLLGRVETASGDATLRDAYAGIVDRYGQYTRGHWPEKVDSDDALRAAQVKAGIAQTGIVLKDLDRYGGHLDVHGLKPSGWFHTQKLGDRWRLVTPDGHAFFSLGVNAVVADGDRTYVQDREFMFKDLPPDHGEWTAFYGGSDNRRTDQGASAGIGYNHGRWFDLYAANLYRVDGKNWLAAWRTRTLDRLQAWGFNTIGNWSDDALGSAHRLPYTRSINIAGNYANVSSGYDYWGRMPDPFDPRFVQATEQAVVKATANVSDDPYLLGYFADNELAWAGQGPQGRLGLAIGTLRGDAKSPAKQAYIAMLKKKYVDPGKLGAAWNLPLTSWDMLQAPGFVPPNPDEAHPAIAEDYSTWLREYADAYFRVVAEAIHRHDPHHLFLGGRFAVNTPEAVAACAQYCDVVSFNVYADLPQHGFDVAAMHKLDKPVLIGEFHFGSDDRGPFGKGVVSVWDERQRGEAYAKFIAAAASDPDIVGAHWFEYTDQPVTGRLLDGENSHIGLVGITDIPFGGFVAAVHAANNAVDH
ncbi:beta-agarase [Rhodanobacter sp. C01]|uniref:beta-agarase n=1 Tax=Rhodanobacter sp. C01 TaxID=1945856 RepID=UPI000985BD83|nr:beta-agarase [Rhodanobacter sp. C01]OOG51272.1 beta-agarase [Rhodanobacter sp. C01]